MRLCDRDIEAWLDEGRLSINPRPPVERINGATVDVRLGEELVQGRFAGLDPEGALLLDTAGGPRRIVSGELLGRAA